MCACACVRPCVRVFLCVRARVCVRACVRACVRVCVCSGNRDGAGCLLEENWLLSNKDGRLSDWLQRLTGFREPLSSTEN